MQDFKVYSVAGRALRSLTVPLPYADSTPLGQSTAHNNVNIDPSDPVSVVKFRPGHGFSATPIVPDVTGAEDVVDAVVVVEEDAVAVAVVEDSGSVEVVEEDSVAVVEDRGSVDVVEVVSRSGFLNSALSQDCMLG
jgi:hypothetical protein